MNTSRRLKKYRFESADERSCKRSVSIYIGTIARASDQDVSDIREAVLSSGAPLVSIYAEAGGKYGFYIVLKFEPGWNDILQQFEIAASLQAQFGQLEPTENTS